MDGLVDFVVSGYFCELCVMSELVLIRKIEG